MSKKQPVMSHDPLAELGEVAQQGNDEPVLAGGAPAITESAGTPGAVDTGGQGVSDTLRLPAGITIADVAELHALLVQRIEDGGALTLDGSDVETVDGAGLQLLAALFREASTKQLALSWQAPSPPLINGATQLGIAEALMLDRGQPAT